MEIEYESRCIEHNDMLGMHIDLSFIERYYSMIPFHNDNCGYFFCIRLVFGLLKSYNADFHQCDWIMLNCSFILYSIFCNFSASNHLIILYNFALLNPSDLIFLSRSLCDQWRNLSQKLIVFVVYARETIFLVHRCI